MRRSVKTGILLVALVLMAVCGLFFLRTKIRSALSTGSLPKPEPPAAVAAASPKPATGVPHTGNAGCDKCMDDCVARYNGDLSTVSGCADLCYDKCEGSRNGGGRTGRPKLKHKERP